MSFDMGAEGRQFLEIMVAKAGVPSLEKGLQHVPQDLPPPPPASSPRLLQQGLGGPRSAWARSTLVWAWLAIGRVDLGGGILFLSCCI